MPFIRLSDNYIDHPKFSCLSDGSFRLWHRVMAYSRTYQTDGLIPLATMRQFKEYSPKRLRELSTPWKEGASPLLETVEDWGLKVHDYLDWNLSKEDENQQRDEARQRMALSRNQSLRNALRIRDGHACRYCRAVVSWTDRRGPSGATYDHIDPKGPDTIENLVIACRGCNARKGSRTPEQAGMPLLPPPGFEPEIRNRLKSDLSFSGKGYGSGTGLEDLERGSGGKPPDDPFNDSDTTQRAGRFVERYAELYPVHRNGARYIGRIHRDYEAAVTLCQTWDDARLEKLAICFLTTDHKFAAEGSRTIPQFRALASWLDGELSKWEAQHAAK